MHLSRAQFNNSAKTSLSRTLMCPYWKNGDQYCPASVMTVAIDIRRKTLYCDTDDHDRCPLFLAKVLRGA